MSSVLPIDAFLPQILGLLSRGNNLVLVAEPGAGKTTRLPPALLSAPFAQRGQVLVLEPRRIAARMAARRVAEELGERPGERVGYMVRFEREVGPRTQLVFLTEALLTRRLLEDPELRGISCVVLDEFHERSLHTDIGLALLRRLQTTRRSELRIVVMSATLDAERLAGFLDAPVLRVPGRAFPVHVEHLERPDERKLEEQVRGAVRKLLVRKIDGDVLVFLPGAAEIRRAQEACEELSRSFELDIAALHGDLPPAEQDRAVRRGPRAKLVLSTNLAETSLTLEGVAAVVDSGLARVASHSPWSGLSTLNTQKVSQASAIQRMGRAGRVREGLCLRLYTKPDLDARPRFDAPELEKADLCETELLLRCMLGADEPSLAWLDPPPEEARTAAIELLTRLSALDAAGHVTELGRALLELPLHPRVGRFALALCERGYHDEAATLAALLSEREIRLSQRTSFGGGRRAHDEVGVSDLLARFEAWEGLRGDLSPQAARRAELDAGAVRAVQRSAESLARSLRRVPRTLDQEFEQAVCVATLLAFPDRVGKRRTPRAAEVVLSGGGSASLAESSVVKESEFLVAFDAEERGKSASIRGASRIEVEWLLEYFPERVRSEQRVAFDPKNERIEGSELMLYDALVLDETRRPGARGQRMAEVLADAALARGSAAPWDADAVDQWQRRSQFAAQYDPKLQAIGVIELRAALIEHCQDKISFEELRREPLEQLLPELVDPELRPRLARLAPAHVKLPSGRELKIHYELDRPPWVESRLQDFFGMLDGPSLAGGKVPLVIHLLAPNQRPVQVTTDLRGFWERHYASIRKELMRRYPRHSWPEDPKTAEPPVPGQRRRP
ncbi:MAG TPA: ATP-dependent helicase HrpB [Polyangiales bacterium]